jgi:pimeloyl-ACP methyl ester carboxylesterase
MANRSRIWKIIRNLWAAAGSIALLGIVVWCYFAYGANAEAKRAMSSNAEVDISQRENHALFSSRKGIASGATGLVFFPGSLVESAAYAPLAQAIARAGHPMLLVDVPLRGALGGADGSEVMERARAAIKLTPQVKRWLVGGHSRGGAIAARFVAENSAAASGLILIGTSHPRDFSLAQAKIPVTKILGTRDGVSEIEKSEKNRHQLPASTRWVLIEGGNHSQFGSYGFQPGDSSATITREQQLNQTVQVVLQALQSP